MEVTPVQGPRGSAKKKLPKQTVLDIDIVPFHATKYRAQVNDIVLGIVVQKNAEFFTVDINADCYANLSTQEFQGATKRDKPRLEEGTLVYCKVNSCERMAKV